MSTRAKPTRQGHCRVKAERSTPPKSATVHLTVSYIRTVADAEATGAGLYGAELIIHANREAGLHEQRVTLPGSYPKGATWDDLKPHLDPTRDKLTSAGFTRWRFHRIQKDATPAGPPPPEVLDGIGKVNALFKEGRSTAAWTAYAGLVAMDEQTRMQPFAKVISGAIHSRRTGKANLRQGPAARHEQQSHKWDAIQAALREIMADPLTNCPTEAAAARHYVKDRERLKLPGVIEKHADTLLRGLRRHRPK